MSRRDGTGEEPAAEHPATGAFFDALNAYAIDPTRWPDLLAQLDTLSEHLESWDPGALVAELSRAESLSWRIKDGVGPGQSGFTWVLLSAKGRVVGSASNLAALSEYLTVDRRGRITFTDPASRASLEAAQASRGGHSLISLTHPARPGHRFGFLIGRDEFPPSLAALSEKATQALFIAQDDNSQRLEQVVQASLGLTAAEADVTMKLAHGLTLREAADDLGISVNTARNHLQSVFDKSGINRQSDLVLVVTQLSVILAGTESDSLIVNRQRRRSPTRHFMILADGRRLAYRTYGDVQDKATVYLHETLGSSSLPPDTDELARAAGLYLIAPERPGFGFSDVDPEFSFDSVSRDVLALLDHLHIDRCILLGYLSGGAYALRLANESPERFEHLMLVAARPPRRMTGRFEHLMPLYTKMIAQPWLMNSFFNILRNRVSVPTNKRLIYSIYGSVPHDRALLDNRPDILDHMIAYTLESVTVTASGVAGELRCFARAEDRPPGHLEMPVTAWHGTADKLSDMKDLESYLAGQPVHWRRFPEAGSLILHEHWPQVLQTLAGAEN